MGKLEKATGESGEKNILTWEKIKKEFKMKYFPANCRQKVFLKIQSFKQNDLRVEEYIIEFDNLMWKGELMEPKKQTIPIFL